jgi:hypothetical protein
MLVSVIIVNYNTFDVTCDCIESVLKYTQGIAYEIVLVDNASTNCNPDLFAERFPSVRLVKNPENNGFAKGNNLGISHAKGDVILLLNSDTVLTEDSISISAKALAQNSSVGFLTCRLVYADGKYQHNARAFRSIRNELLDLARPLLKLMPYEKRAKLMLNQYFHGDFSTVCDWVSGAFMMFRKSLLQQLPEGKLDERFFMYGEDMLWCHQAAEAGYGSYFLSDTTVIHIANASTEPEKQLKLLHTTLKHDLEVMRLQRGNSLYFYALQFIYTTKEKLRYYIKAVVMKLFKYRIR